MRFDVLYDQLIAIRSKVIKSVGQNGKEIQEQQIRKPILNTIILIFLHNFKQYFQQVNKKYRMKQINQKFIPNIFKRL
ncbi:unnamed protein product [Paramecium octaurelia]|uniref:Uncharacterized protein n=1 Tax=Paramecium octaurelia TaxID=43137 RepID=A0A8S1WT63_PAROT|nr:unnamed protein product [Paramecium octaurelia]